MKRTYINPTIEIVKVESQQIMAGSPYNLNNEEKKDPTTADSRGGRGFWDDEEEEY